MNSLNEEEILAVSGGVSNEEEASLESFLDKVNRSRNVGFQTTFDGKLN